MTGTSLCHRAAQADVNQSVRQKSSVALGSLVSPSTTTCGAVTPDESEPAPSSEEQAQGLGCLYSWGETDLAQGQH